MTGRARRALVIAGHYNPHAMAVMALALGGVLPLGGKAPGILAIPCVGSSAAALVTQVADVLFHSWRLCGRCAAQAPGDPGAAVRSWRLILRLHHSKVANALTALAVASLIGGGALYLAGHRWGWLSFPLPPSLAVLALSCLAYDRHRILRPWCPHCDWAAAGRPEPRLRDPGTGGDGR